MRFCASLISLSEISIDAQEQLAQARRQGEVLTGLLYLAPDAEDLHAHLNAYACRSNKLGEKTCAWRQGCSRRSTPLCASNHTLRRHLATTQGSWVQILPGATLLQAITE